jgi:hypothetical protein
LKYFGEDTLDFDANPAFEFLSPGEKRKKRMRSGTKVARDLHEANP